MNNHNKIKKILITVKEDGTIEKDIEYYSHLDCKHFEPLLDHDYICKKRHGLVLECDPICDDFEVKE